MSIIETPTLNTRTAQAQVMSNFSVQQVLDGVALALLVITMGTVYTVLIVVRLFRGQPVFQDAFDNQPQHSHHPLR